MGKRRGNRLREHALTNPEILNYAIQIVKGDKGSRFTAVDIFKILQNRGYDISSKRVCLLIPRISSEFTNIQRHHNERLNRWEYFIPIKEGSSHVS